MAQGRDGESGIAIRVDVMGAVASFQNYFEADGERYWDSWDSQRDIQHSIKGNIISANGTMKRIGRRVAQGEALWSYVQDVETIEAPFTLSTSCPR